MKNILFTYKIEDEGLNEKKSQLKKIGYNVYYEKESTFEYKEYMKDIEILVCYNPFKKLDIAQFPRLEWIQLTSMGFDQIPLESVLKRNIIVTNNRGGYSIPIGEWVVLNILELIKNRKKAYQNQASKKWFMDHTVREIYNKKITFIGTGDIAQQAAKRLHGFGVKILGVNTDGRRVNGFDQCFTLNDLDYVLELSDIVVISIPHTSKTQHLFNKTRLEKMKKEACLINVSRGAIIHEGDLIQHLEAGNLGGVALDVFEKEPLPQESKLWEMDRVVITSHNSWISEKVDERRWNLILSNLKKYIHGEKLVNVVDLTRGY